MTDNRFEPPHQPQPAEPYPAPFGGGSGADHDTSPLPRTGPNFGSAAPPGPGDAPRTPFAPPPGLPPTPGPQVHSSYGPPHRPGRRRSGPGWGALIGACLVCALLGGGLAAGVGAVLDNDTSARSGTPISSAASQAPAPPIGDGTLDWTRVAGAVSPSVVSIQISGAQVSGAGSGVIIDTEGHILTNNHVASAGGSGASLQVALSDGRIFDDVRIVGTDPATDLAVLQIQNPPADLTPLPFGDSSKVVAGQPVMAVGNPLDLSDTITTGIVSATDRPVITDGSTDGSGNGDLVVTNAIQTDAAINPGNSGGALVDASGSLIGIPSSIAAMSGGSGEVGSIGLGFAIPSNEVKRISEELIRDGVAQHAWLGVQLGDGTATVDGQTYKGAQIGQVVDNTPASKSGLRAGDVVTAVDGEPVPGGESLTAQVRERAPGQTVTLTVARDGGAQEITVTLGVRSS